MVRTIQTVRLRVSRMLVTPTALLFEHVVFHQDFLHFVVLIVLAPLWLLVVE